MPQNKWDKKLGKNISGYDSTLERLYRDVITEASAIGASVSDMARDSFEWSKHPKLRKRLDALVRELNSDVYTVIVDGIDSAWTLANNKNNELCRQVFGDKIGKLTDEQYKRYFSTNGDAKDAFLTRKTAGLNLSDRVWKYTSGYKDEIETALELGIKEGKSAASMTRDLNRYLMYPDELFRRVRDAATGKLHLSKPALKFIEENHPGQGVYLSSFKNARRLAATETNIAYRTADYLRYQQEDFVVGIRIGMSNNHPVPDICDELKGDYPKDFKFVGWHPHCRCVAIPILKTEEELFRDNERILNGEEPLEDSVNRVEDVPNGLVNWIRNNKERIDKTNSVPYFIADNSKFTGIRIISRRGYKGTYGNSKLGRTATREALTDYEQSAPIILSPEQAENIKEASDKIGISPVAPMTFSEADEGRANMGYGKYGYSDNCQSTVVIHEARLRGLDITALPYSSDNTSVQYLLGEDFRMAWRTKSGGIPQVTKIKGKSDAETIAKIEKQMSAPGRYHIGVNYTDDTGHMLTAERLTNGNLYFYDPQSGFFVNIKEYTNIDYLELLKVDKLLFDTDVLKGISKVI